MTIDWMEYNNEDHVLAWLLVEAMSVAGIEHFGDFDSSKLEVVLTVNNIEVDIVTSMKLLQNQLKDIKEQGRRKGYHQALSDVTNSVDKLMELCNE